MHKWISRKWEREEKQFEEIMTNYKITDLRSSTNPKQNEHKENQINSPHDNNQSKKASGEREKEQKQRVKIESK